MNPVTNKKPRVNEATTDRSDAIIADARSSEMFFGVVGPVGAGGSRAIQSLKRACEEAEYECVIIKASAIIRKWAETNDYISKDTDSKKTLDYVISLQDFGDKMREKDLAEVARSFLNEIAEKRARAQNQPYISGQPVQPNDSKRAYLIDSIRHPAEVNLLRRTYASAFALIGVVCEESERRKRILNKYFTTPEQNYVDTKSDVEKFMRRDSDDPEKRNGQHVADAFLEADFFVDNTMPDPSDKDQLLDEPLSRLIRIISHSHIVRPTIEETAMHHAFSACVRSSCLSRQVGAALVDKDGTIVATGVNEVPRAGGGVYGENMSGDGNIPDHRCAFRDLNGKPQFCSNNREQNKIIKELIKEFPELHDVANVQTRVRKTRLGQLIEFSRAVHAEMDALLSASREGTSTIGTRLFVTTFPCHYCARHIVSAGVYEVQFIEPYPKSLAIELHNDAIETNPVEWSPPKTTNSLTDENAMKVLFHPFVGVAPRLYIRAFKETRQLKDKATGVLLMQRPEWGDDWAPFTKTYPELEVVLARTD